MSPRMRAVEMMHPCKDERRCGGPYLHSTGCETSDEVLCHEVVQVLEAKAKAEAPTPEPIRAPKDGLEKVVMAWKIFI